MEWPAYAHFRCTGPLSDTAQEHFWGSDLLFTVLAHLALSSTLPADPHSYDMSRRRNNKSTDNISIYIFYIIYIYIYIHINGDNQFYVIFYISIKGDHQF